MNNLDEHQVSNEVLSNNDNQQVPVKDYVQRETELVNATGMMLNSLEGDILAVNQSLESINKIAGTVCSSITEWKKIDSEMLEMNLHFEKFAKELDTDLAKYQSRIPIIEKQLDAIDSNLSKILDFVLGIDAKTEQEMEMKLRWMDTMQNFLNTISDTMIKLL